MHPASETLLCVIYLRGQWTTYVMINVDLMWIWAECHFPSRSPLWTQTTVLKEIALIEIWMKFFPVKKIEMVRWLLKNLFIKLAWLYGTKLMIQRTVIWWPIATSFAKRKCHIKITSDLTLRWLHSYRKWSGTKTWYWPRLPFHQSYGREPEIGFVW